ncbi:MAG: VWA domain-containing protein [Clostridia bacterium]|nr:VWA domain-containing protein [Clostridia bacterium]
MKSSKKDNVILAVIAIIVVGLIIAVICSTQNWGKTQEDINYEKSVKDLNKLYSSIKVKELALNKDYEFVESENYTVLPDISEYPFVVNPTTDNYLVIYSSPEKAGAGYESFLIDVANKFNQSGITVDGVPVSVGIRSISSGLAADFISSNKYVPDVYAPSNELWGELLNEKGIKINLVEKRIAGNVAGIVLSRSKNDELQKKYGTVDEKTIINGVLNNEVSIAYTDPYSSSTGLNFILTTLYNFDSTNPLSENAISEFKKFQQNIPFTAYNTLQMKESAQAGSLDGFLLEYQTFVNSPDLTSSYVFIPFGVRHDSPIYEIGDLSDIKKKITSKFVDFCKSSEAQGIANEKGFNGLNDYSYDRDFSREKNIAKAQGIWKTEKTGNSGITAVFVADISGSMEGSPLLKLKASLNQATNFIGSDADIGFVTFSDTVNIAVPIAKFDSTQKSYFSNAVKNLRASGGTAMFDAIIVAEKMLIEAKEKNPDTRLMLFVLTDGETNRGHKFSDIEDITRNLKIPIYTIGYNADIDVLKQLSNINEAATMDAENDNIIYRLESLFNSQM